jgi:prepilin signal peptidase PulO-like enzyme (type II secretory pathway)
LSIFFGAVFGAVFGIAGMIFSHQKLRSEIPFGPYLALGAFLSLLFGKDFMDWYAQSLLLF